MTEAKHWKVYDGPQISPIFSGIVCMISASDRLIAVITEDETPVDPRTWSDIARLIAAAPDMHAALQKIIDMNVQYAIDRYGDASKAESMSCVEVARAALSKAGLPQ